MRKRILELLRNNQNAPVSGEEISRQLEVSRTAIWKHIQALKDDGYEIESVPKKGYVLKELPDRLYPAEINAHLNTKWLGRSICYEDSIDSSNNVAKIIANKGCDNGLLVVCEEQTGGKGRLQRGWISPHHHGIWFSVVLKPPFLPEEAPKFTLLAAVAVVKAINKVKGVNAAIKWPNDILLLGRKMVGILTEMSAEFGHINYVVIGTGVNTNGVPEDYPPEVRDLAVSVCDAAQEPFTRVELLCDMLKNMEDLYELAVEKGFDAVLAEWRKYSCTIGQSVKVIAPDKTYYGKAIDIDSEGLLIVEKDDGEIEKVVAGDVSIRPAAAKDGAYA